MFLELQDTVHQDRMKDVEYDLATMHKRFATPDPRADFDLQTEFFPNLSTQCGLQGFARLDLAAGKLPKTGQRHPGTALSDKTPSVLDDRGPDNVYGR